MNLCLLASTLLAGVVLESQLGGESTDEGKLDSPSSAPGRRGGRSCVDADAAGGRPAVVLSGENLLAEVASEAGRVGRSHWVVRWQWLT